MPFNRLFTRRKLLAGSALALFQPVFPARLLAGQKVRRAFPKHVISPTPGNPFFKPLGPPLRGERPTPPPFHGKKVSGAGADAGTNETRGRINASKAAVISGGVGVRSQPEDAGPQSGVGGVAAANAATASTPSTLILYDTSGTWGWLGEIYAMMAGNLASHFGAWTAMPVARYASGGINDYTTVIYIGSTFGEAIPTAFLDDVYSSTAQRVIWISYNIWQLIARQSSFVSRYGWNISTFDYSSVAGVDYKSQSLKRYAANQSGIMNYSTYAPNQAIAYCVRSDATRFPWALRSQNLTYIGEIPFNYVTEGDRYLIFCDLLFDALAPNTTTLHRAFVRLEDIHPNSNPSDLKSVAQWLGSNKIPFGFQITPRYLDPIGYYNGGVPMDIRLSATPAMIAAIQYALSLGGILMGHGYTHQYSNIDNPYSGVTGEDCEFYRITQDPTTLKLTYVAPVSEDTSQSWALGRFSYAKQEFVASGLANPTTHTFPCYAAGVNDSIAASSAFSIRSERALYFSGLLSGGAIDYSRLQGQYFPYTVKDIYCNLAQSNCKVLADSLGGVSPQAWGGYPARLPADIVADAQRLLVVRDSVASFFHHIDQPLSDLQTIVQGLQSLGYTFVSPTTL